MALRNDEEQRIYSLALKTWGWEAQMGMLVEECAELIQAVNKKMRQGPGGGYDRMVDEMADVQIMLNQMALVVNRDAFERRKTVKLERLAERLGVTIDFTPKGGMGDEPGADAV